MIFCACGCVSVRVCEQVFEGGTPARITRCVQYSHLVPGPLPLYCIDFYDSPKADFSPNNDVNIIILCAIHTDLYTLKKQEGKCFK